ncbi:LacI family DNA-binding transcriptional regulator [Novosphingobium sp. PASSN1]|uniref:LacI family DNA-binding transcriptional regulator n=1 Tax=Novosphingobium sp. PASSN1 TaxID=2015561 RepID=UPI000BDAD4BE|nr:LacI family DNA-binding transcriptional regulator [Novosphingobium sp. PASSN1]OYU35422.1 MAG: alanine racemase [Novosphingobium sp. PASSN1]
MTRPKRSTIVDVARMAGVSAKTVSRVVNNEPHVTEAVKTRVHEAMRELRYHPNVAAQGLVRSRSYLIGLVYEKPSPSYVVELQKGALERLHGERFRLVVLPVESVTERADEIIALLRSAALDAVLLAPPASDHAGLMAELREVGMPFARISPTRLLGQGPSVAMDDVAAAQEAAEHIVALGHKRIGVIKGDPSHAAADARLVGTMQALAKAGIALRPELIEAGLFTFDSGLAAARRLLALDPPPTAILAQNDDMAAATMAAAREAGLHVPEDLSVVGFDDSDISRVVWPPLTTIRQPVEEMAYKAMDMLLDVLKGEPEGGDIQLPHELLIRRSTAPPKAD